MRAETEERLARLRGLLAQRGAAGLVILRQNNFAWLTGGGRGYINTSMDPGAVCALVTADRAVLVAPRSEEQRVLEEEIGDGWESAAYDWWEEGEPARLVAQHCPPGPLLADMAFAGAVEAGTEVAALRWSLSPAEQDRARSLGLEVALSFEAAARGLEPGMTEHEASALIARQLLSRAIEPQVKLVAFDGRSERWRHPIPTANRLSRYALLAGCGQRHGLVISVTRLVHFGPPPPGLRERLTVVASVFAALTGACRPGLPASRPFAAALKAYSAAGYPDGWRTHHLGGLSAYVSREYKVSPTSPYQMDEGQLFAWNPTLPGVKCEDVFLLTGGSPVMITDTGQWPRLGADYAHAADLLIR